MNCKLSADLFLLVGSSIETQSIFFFLLLASKDPILSVPVKEPKVTAALWGPLDQYIITGHENGDLCQWDTKVWYGLH